MAVVISMLRGVNVGGHNKIKMEALRALYESLKLRDAQTYVQSGNVISGPTSGTSRNSPSESRMGLSGSLGFGPM